MKRTYHGSCHCGAVRFECELALSEGTSKCNCSICTKTRFWKAIVKADAFRLLQGEDVLVDYQFGANAIHHLFCSRCGVKGFGQTMFRKDGREVHVHAYFSMRSALSASRTCSNSLSSAMSFRSFRAGSLLSNASDRVAICVAPILALLPFR